jgi:uncharacterized protein
LPFCVDTPDGVLLAVRVIPRARRTETAGTRPGEDGDALVVRLAAPPVEGAANEAVIDLLSSVLHIPRKQIEIVSGERGRQKRVAITGMTAEQVRLALQA